MEPFNLSKFANVKSILDVYRTSPSLDLAKNNINVSSKNINDTLPAYSINTYVISLEDNYTSTPTKSPTPTVTPTSVYASGDLNGDGVINMADIIILATSFNSVRGEGKYVESNDINRDGVINMADVIIIAAKFNTTV